MTKATPEQPEIRILKKATCPTLSGKSTLTYHIGCTPGQEIHIRVHANDGGGYFSQEWVAFEDIQKALEKASPITSIALYPLFKGKSVNTPAFLLAVLKNEGLLQPVNGKKRSHELLDSETFIDKVEKLMASTVDSKAPNTAKKTVKKAPAKKTAKKAPVKKTTKKAPIRKKASTSRRK